MFRHAQSTQNNKSTYLRNGWLDHIDLVHANSPPSRLHFSWMWSGMPIFNHLPELSCVSCFLKFRIKYFAGTQFYGCHNGKHLCISPILSYTIFCRKVIMYHLMLKKNNIYVNKLSTLFVLGRGMGVGGVVDFALLPTLF